MAAVFLFLIRSFINDIYFFSDDWKNTSVSLAVDLLLIFFIKNIHLHCHQYWNTCVSFTAVFLILIRSFINDIYFFNDDWQNTFVSLAAIGLLMTCFSRSAECFTTSVSLVSVRLLLICSFIKDSFILTIVAAQRTFVVLLPSTLWPEEWDSHKTTLGKSGRPLPSCPPSHRFISLLVNYFECFIYRLLITRANIEVG